MDSQYVISIHELVKKPCTITMSVFNIVMELMAILIIIPTCISGINLDAHVIYAFDYKVTCIALSTTFNVYTKQTFRSDSTLVVFLIIICAER